MSELTEVISSVLCLACQRPGFHRTEAVRVQRMLARRGSHQVLALCVDTRLWHLTEGKNHAPGG